MKKLLLMVALFTTVYVTKADAQEQKQAGDPAAMMQRYKDKVKPLIIEKAKLTEAEAERVLTIHFSYSERLRYFKDATEDEKKKQAEILSAAENKEFTAIPLTEEKITAVNAFFAEQKAQREKRMQEGAKGKN